MSAEGVVPARNRVAGWEGLNVKPDAGDGVAREGRMDRSHPALAGLSGEETVSPSEATAERSDRPARAEDVVHRRQDSLWEQVFSHPSYPSPCPTPTGNASEQPDEPPDAGPHVRWCGRRAGRPGPPTRFRTAGRY